MPPQVNTKAKILQFRTMSTIMNGLMERIGWRRGAGTTFGGRRDPYTTFGFKTPEEMTYADYYLRWRRGGIAKRIVKIFPAWTWKNPPLIWEIEEEGEFTAFEKGLAELTLRVPVWAKLRAGDIMAGIGQYAVIYLSFDDNRDPSFPVRQGAKLIGMEVFKQVDAEIREFGKVIGGRDGRFNLPTMYALDFSRQSTTRKPLIEQAVPSVGKKNVHWTRILHIPSDDCLEDAVLGTPRLEASWNDLDSLDKIIYGTGEGFYRNADRAFHLNVDKEVDYDDEEKKEEIDDEAQAFINQWERIMVTQGATMTAFKVDIADPRGPFAATMQVITGTHAVPMRILVGSERGELASTQDRENFASEVRDRQRNHAEPFELRAFLDRMIYLESLPRPMRHKYGEGVYEIEWGDPVEATESELADRGLKFANAARAISQQAGNALVSTPDEFRGQFMKRLPLEKEQIEKTNKDNVELRKADPNALPRNDGTTPRGGAAPVNGNNAPTIRTAE